MYVGVRAHRGVLAHGVSLRAHAPGCSGQRSFALAHEVAGDVAQGEHDPEEGHSTQHLQGDAQLARAQPPGDPRVRTAGT